MCCRLTLAGGIGLCYTGSMETISHLVRDLSPPIRSAAEHLVGHDLRENQRLVIQVLDAIQLDAEQEAARRQAIIARMPSDSDLELIAIDPPKEWLAERNWT